MKTSVKLQVQELLTKHVKTRDNSFLLYSELLLQYYNYSNTISLKEFFLLQLKKDIPNFEYVCRLSRRLQSQIPNLRGETWTKRQKMQTTYLTDLGYKN